MQTVFVPHISLKAPPLSVTTLPGGQKLVFSKQLKLMHILLCFGLAKLKIIMQTYFNLRVSPYTTPSIGQYTSK